MRLPWAGRSLNQYYTLTAMLAAHGAQTFTSRVIASFLAALGFLLLLMLVSPLPLREPGGAALLGAVVVACFVTAAIWLRHRWPTRTESAFLAGGSMVAVPIACLVPVDPAYGLAGATSFALMIGYVALLHGMRLLSAIITVAVATVIFLAVSIADRAPLLAVVSATMLLLLFAFAAFSCRLVVRLTGTAVGPDGYEPLTGLLNREAFDEQTATLMASRNRDDDRYLVVAVVNIDSFAAMVSVLGNRGGNQARIAAGQALRETVRRNAIVAHIGDAEYLIADTFTTTDPSPLVERVRGAIAATPTGMTASIGVVSTPLRPLAEHPPHEVLDEIVALATTAMHEARRAGGNQARYVVRPTLDILDDDDEPETPLV